MKKLGLLMRLDRYELFGINRRMHDHIRSGKLSGDNSIFAYKQADGRASQARINDHERSKIEQHKPELNQRAGGAGRPYKR